MFDAAIALHNKGGDAIKIAKAYLAISESGKYTCVNEEAMEEIIATSGPQPKWPMSFAEAAEVQKWARTMWRHAPVSADQD